MEYVEKVSENREHRTKNVSQPNYALREKSPLAPHFSGKLILLADGGSYSATTEFIALVRLYHRGVIVGEETGGGFYGCTAGKIYTDQLPNTGIKVFVPTLRFINSTHDDEPKGHGIYPDYEVPLAYDDWIVDHDAVLEFALNLTKK